jgi:hypothetical protein
VVFARMTVEVLDSAMRIGAGRCWRPWEGGRSVEGADLLGERPLLSAADDAL